LNSDPTTPHRKEVWTKRIEYSAWATPSKPRRNPTGAVLYAGNAPGLVSGVTQINFQMPDLAPPVFSNPPVIGPPYAAGVTMTVSGSTMSAYVWFE
jgi:hypothetical protein